MADSTQDEKRGDSAVQLVTNALAEAETRYVAFLFQAEDGIRDELVTGVQTCALPLCGQSPRAGVCASRDSGTPSAHASARRLATTLAMIGMSAPETFSKINTGQRRRRSYSRTSAMTSYSSVTGSVTRTTSAGKACSYAATKSRTLCPATASALLEGREEARGRALRPRDLVEGRCELHAAAAQGADVGEPLHDHDAGTEDHAVHREVFGRKVGQPRAVLLEEVD